MCVGVRVCVGGAESRSLCSLSFQHFSGTTRNFRVPEPECIRRPFFYFLFFFSVKVEHLQ